MKRPIALFTAVALIITALIVPVKAQEIAVPAVGQMLSLSKAYTPVSIKGLIIDPKQPFNFDFVLDMGDTGLNTENLKEESMKLIKYFLAALTVPEQDMWVNLSPYEKNRIIEPSFGETQMGRDLLIQDYILKQLSASLTYPEKEMGQKFWNEVYKEVRQPNINTFNKIWIVPDRASIYENDKGVFVIDSHLKVMMEEDYLATEKNRSQPGDIALAVSPSWLPSDKRVENESTPGKQRNSNTTNLTMKTLILPAIEREVNEGAHFANLRQIYQAMILATWYKMRLKDSIIGKLYVDQHKTNGIEYKTLFHKSQVKENSVIASAAKQSFKEQPDTELIYQQYLQAFKKGVYNYIKETPGSGVTQIPRKYFSGGFDSAQLSRVVSQGFIDRPSSIKAHGDLAMVSFYVRDEEPRNIFEQLLKTYQHIQKLEEKSEYSKEWKELRSRYEFIVKTRSEVKVVLDIVRDYVKSRQEGLLKAYLRADRDKTVQGAFKEFWRGLIDRRTTSFQQEEYVLKFATLLQNAPPADKAMRVISVDASNQPAVDANYFIARDLKSLIKRNFKDADVVMSSLDFWENQEVIAKAKRITNVGQYRQEMGGAEVFKGSTGPVPLHSTGRLKLRNDDENFRFNKSLEANQGIIEVKVTIRERAHDVDMTYEIPKRINITRKNYKAIRALTKEENNLGLKTITFYVVTGITPQQRQIFSNHERFDNAMISTQTDKVASDNVGGIDLDAKNLKLEATGQALNLSLPNTAQNIDNIQINGLSPVILKITAIPNIDNLVR